MQRLGLLRCVERGIGYLDEEDKKSKSGRC